MELSGFPASTRQPYEAHNIKQALRHAVLQHGQKGKKGRWGANGGGDTMDGVNWCVCGHMQPCGGGATD
jgi:hypothetical protein